MGDIFDAACGSRMPGGEIRREHGYQTRPGNAEGAGAAPTARGGAAAAGCTAGRGCSLGRGVAAVGAGLFAKQDAAREGLLSAFGHASGLCDRSVHARPCYGRVLPEMGIRVRLELSPKWRDLAER